MISLNDQNDMFRLISSNLTKDIICYAFGGTAMLYFGMKNATKDIDLVFEKQEDRQEFIKAIKLLGYKSSGLKGIYPEKKQKSDNIPLMFTRGDERFDLFLKKIFYIDFTRTMRSRFYEKHDFMFKDKSLIVFVLSKEDIIMLKSATERERDFEDILNLVNMSKDIDWDIIIDEANSQKDSYVLFDIEKTIRRLKETVFIPEKILKKLYKE